MDYSDLVIKLQGYANSIGHGYLKTWKAGSIVSSIIRQPSILNDEVRFLAYIKNCLEMEGFRSVDCELIMGWLYERMNGND